MQTETLRVYYNDALTRVYHFRLLLLICILLFSLDEILEHLNIKHFVFKNTPKTSRPRANINIIMMFFCNVRSSLIGHRTPFLAVRGVSLECVPIYI